MEGQKHGSGVGHVGEGGGGDRTGTTSEVELHEGIVVTTPTPTTKTDR